MTAVELGIGMDIILWFQSWRTTIVTCFFLPFNYFATEIVYLLLFPVIFWCINKDFGRRIMILSLLSMWSNTFFKNWWQRPRPFQVPGSKVIPAVHASGYGLPSGHTMSATVFAGYIITEAKKQWVTIVLIVFILLMGISRMVHGVHYPQDVIAGLFISIVFIAVFNRIEPKMSIWMKKQKLRVPIILSLFLPFVCILLFLLVGADMAGFEDSITAIAPVSGGLIGLAFESRYIMFKEKGNIKIKFLRAFFGIVIMLILYFGLRFPAYAILNAFSIEGEYNLVLAVALRLIRYGVLGLWITLGAPFVFIKLKLAEKAVE